MQCYFFMLDICIERALSAPTRPHDSLAPTQTKRHDDDRVVPRKIASFTFGYLVLVGVSSRAVLFSVTQTVLRGSNNKHLLLKCINCNKNNNKLKQLREGKQKKLVEC